MSPDDVAHAEWRKLRLDLLTAEKELQRARDASAFDMPMAWLRRRDEYGRES